MVLTLAPIAWCQVSWECSSGDMVRPLNGSDRTLLFSDKEYNRTFELESSMYGIYYLRWASTVARAVTSVWERHQSLERLNYLSHLHITHTRNSTLDGHLDIVLCFYREWMTALYGIWMGCLCLSLHFINVFIIFLQIFRLLVRAASVCTCSLNKLRNKTYCCEPEPKLNPSLISPIVSTVNSTNCWLEFCKNLSPPGTFWQKMTQWWLVESPSIEKEVMASNVIGTINLFISILFKIQTCSRKNFHQIMSIPIIPTH